MAPTGVDMERRGCEITIHALAGAATGRRRFPTPGPSAKPPDPATRRRRLENGGAIQLEQIHQWSSAPRQTEMSAPPVSGTDIPVCVD